MVVSTIFQLIKEAKYLEAEIVYRENIESMCTESISSNHHHLFAQMLHRASQVKDVLKDNTNETTTSLSETASDGWILGMTYLGVTTHYKMDESNYLHVKMEGILDDIDIFKSAAVIYEVDYFSHWLRFLNHTQLIHKVDVTELIAYFSTYIPPLSRDTVVHVYAADCLTAHDQIVLIGKSENDWPIYSSTTASTSTTALNPSTSSASLTSMESQTVQVDKNIKLSSSQPQHQQQQQNTLNSSSNNITEDEVVLSESIVREDGTSSSSSNNSNNIHTAGIQVTNTTTITPPSSSSSPSESTTTTTSPTTVTIPWQAVGWFHDRMDIRDFKAVFTVLSAARVKTTFFACIDPRAALPRSVVNFVIRNIAGLFLYLFQKQVLKVGNFPDCPYNDRVRQNPAFYRDWLLPKLKTYYELKGWDFHFENNSLMDTVIVGTRTETDDSAQFIPS